MSNHDKMSSGEKGVVVRVGEQTNTVIYEGEHVTLEQDPSELGHLEIIAQAQHLKARRVSL